MGKDYQEIDERMQNWIEQQHLFFVSTAPLSNDGLINCSPKGLDCLRVLGPRKIAYADTGGSGAETIAHLKENGRIVIMLCAFSGPPKIFRFYGHGISVEPHETEFEALSSSFSGLPTNLTRTGLENVCTSSEQSGSEVSVSVSLFEEVLPFLPLPLPRNRC